MRRLLSPRWLLVHAAAVILVVGFLLLCWWQVSRAKNGNMLSFGYAIEWPAFAAFVVYVWIKEMRQALRSGTTEPASDASPGTSAVAPEGRIRRRTAHSQAAYDDSAEPELAAYNRYLTWLNAHPHASPSEYPG